MRSRKVGVADALQPKQCHTPLSGFTERWRFGPNESYRPSYSPSRFFEAARPGRFHHLHQFRFPHLVPPSRSFFKSCQALIHFFYKNTLISDSACVLQTCCPRGQFCSNLCGGGYSYLLGEVDGGVIHENLAIWADLPANRNEPGEKREAFMMYLG